MSKRTVAILAAALVALLVLAMVGQRSGTTPTGAGAALIPDLEAALGDVERVPRRPSARLSSFLWRRWAVTPLLTRDIDYFPLPAYGIRRSSWAVWALGASPTPS